MNHNQKIKTNYGALTEISKNFNQAFGDRSGRSISLRSAHGFKKVFKAHDMSDDDAEHIVHGGMVAATYLLNSKDDGAKFTGVLLSFGLFIFYQEGK